LKTENFHQLPTKVIWIQSVKQPTNRLLPHLKLFIMNPVDQNINELPHDNVPFFSRQIPGLRGRSTVYVDNLGYAYYQHSIKREIR